MDLRIKNLDALDPRAVVLPHGTEVVTRSEKMLGERRIPEGSVGRVASVDGERVQVLIVGMGHAWYGRDELVARRVGQALFARRRAASWSALAPCVVLEAVVGSNAWGLANAQSDVDRRGVFALPFSWSTGLVAPPEDLVSEDGSATYWATGKAIRQGLRADPNTLEMLFLDSVRAPDSIGQWMLEERDAFVSTEIYGSFGRYAIGQLRRLEQGSRLFEHRARLVEWLRAEPTLTLDTVASRLAAAVGLVATMSTESEAHLRAKEYVKQVYRSLADQGLLPSSDFPALVQFARTQSTDFELPRELRPKNAYNLIRLLATATYWLREGLPRFAFDGALRERMLAIKSGGVALAEVLAEAEGMVPELERARDASPLPARPNLARADALCRRIGAELARRFALEAPGPFGTDAPNAPEVEWIE